MSILAFLSTQVIDTTTVGRSVMTAVDAAAARTAIGAQPLDADLTALAALSGTNDIYYRSAANTWTSVTIGTGLTFTGGTLAASGGAGISGSTGAVDNAILRADGTGGATLQASSIVIADNYTASPNNTVNHASLQATGGTTNVSVSLVPKGTGAFCLAVPDGTGTGGNVRGASAIDLQTSRTAAAQVASGTAAAILGGTGNTASGTNAVALGAARGTASGQSSLVQGEDSAATGAYSVALGLFSRATNYGAVSIGPNGLASGNQGVAISTGNGATASGQTCLAIGSSATASATNAVALGFSASANRQAMAAYAQGQFAAIGDAQEARWVLRNKTTDGATAVTLFADGSSVRCSLTSGKILHATVLILGSKSDGSAVAEYCRQVCIKNVGGTTSLVGTVNTIGTDTAAGTTIAITADDTNDALQIAVTGVTNETWRWVATVVGPELAYGT